MLCLLVGQAVVAGLAVGLSSEIPAASRYPTVSDHPPASDYPASPAYYSPGVKPVSSYGKLRHESLVNLDSRRKPSELQTYVSQHLIPHYEALVCHGLNSSFHMHIDARITLGCSLATETAVGPANKYSKCEADIMGKFSLCQDGDHACYINMLENLETCLGVCCGDHLELCQAAMCRGLERSYVDVKGGFAMCKAHVYPGPIVNENCPFLTPLWMDCAPWITAARRGCNIPLELELVEDYCVEETLALRGHVEDNCVRAALALGGHEECYACTGLVVDDIVGEDVVDGIVGEDVVEDVAVEDVY